MASLVATVVRIQDFKFQPGDQILEPGCHDFYLQWQTILEVHTTCVSLNHHHWVSWQWIAGQLAIRRKGVVIAYHCPGCGSWFAGNPRSTGWLCPLCRAVAFSPA